MVIVLCSSTVYSKYRFTRLASGFKSRHAHEGVSHVKM